MKIRILGTRGKIPQSAPDHRNHTGVLIDDILLVDVGESGYLDHKPKAILFTHFHPDHAFFVSGQETFSPGVPVHGPEPHELVQDIQVISGTFKIGDYQITPVPVIHALHLRSLAYRIERQGKSVFITGDVAWIEKAQIEKLAAVDLVITEATFLQKGGVIRRRQDHIFGHTGVPDLIRLLSPLSSRIAFLHYGSWFFKDPEGSRKKLRRFGSPELEIIPTRDDLELRI